MSMPIRLESTATVPAHRRWAARLAVAVARVLAGWKPLRLRRALELASRGARPATAAQALAARRAVVTVSRRCAGQQCLQRAVATALLCRLGGAWPQWCTGVRTEPFRAHAWVEAAGQAIGEPDDMRLFHKVMVVSVADSGTRRRRTRWTSTT